MNVYAYVENQEREREGETLQREALRISTIMPHDYSLRETTGGWRVLHRHVMPAKQWTWNVLRNAIPATTNDVIVVVVVVVGAELAFPSFTVEEHQRRYGSGFFFFSTWICDREATHTHIHIQLSPSPFPSHTSRLYLRTTQTILERWNNNDDPRTADKFRLRGK